jgi:hypothetical protein
MYRSPLDASRGVRILDRNGIPRVSEAGPEETTMSERTKALVLRHHEVWSRGALSAVDEIYEPDFVGYNPGQLDWTGQRTPRQVSYTVYAIA